MPQSSFGPSEHADSMYKYECWRTTDQRGQRLATVASTYQMLQPETAHLQMPPTETS